MIHVAAYILFCLINLQSSYALDKLSSSNEEAFGPWGMDFFEEVKGFVSPLPMILEQRGPSKAGFTLLATGAEIRASEETVRMMKHLRDIDRLPIHGLWIENQHIRFSPSEVQPLVALANEAGFHTIVRIPDESRVSIQGYLGIGAKGLVIPMIESPKQIKEAFDNAYYGGWREIGLEPDSSNLRANTADDYAAVDREKILAFMIESVAGMAQIESLAREAAKLADQFGVDRSHIVFWLGPFDAKKNHQRLKKASSQETEKWWKASVQKISKEASSKGISMGSNVYTLEEGISMMTEHQFRIFSISGMSGSFGNPRVPSTGRFFLNTSNDQRRFLLKKPVLALSERERISAKVTKLNAILSENTAPNITSSITGK